MKTILKVIAALMVGFLLLYLLYFLSGLNRLETSTKSTTFVIKGDTVTKWLVVKVPVPDTIWEDGEIVTLPADNECMAELIRLRAMYGRYKVYNDTLIDDSSLFVNIVDTIHNNRIIGRSFGYQNRKNTSITTIINTQNVSNKGFYVGGFAGKNILNLSLLYQRGNFVVQSGYELNNKTVVFGLFYHF